MKLHHTPPSMQRQTLLALTRQVTNRVNNDATHHRHHSRNNIIHDGFVYTTHNSWGNNQNKRKEYENNGPLYKKIKTKRITFNVNKCFQISL